MLVVRKNTFFELDEDVAHEEKLRAAAIGTRSGSSPPAFAPVPCRKRRSKRPAPASQHDIDACCAEFHPLLQQERWEYLCGLVIERLEAKERLRRKLSAKLHAILPQRLFDHWRFHVGASQAEITFLFAAGRFVPISGGRICFFATDFELDTQEGLNCMFEKAVLHRTLWNEGLFLLRALFPDGCTSALMYLGYLPTVSTASLREQAKLLLLDYGVRASTKRYRLTSLGKDLCGATLASCDLHPGCLVTFSDK